MATKKFKSLQELLSDRKRWCQGDLALSKSGKPIEVKSPHAVSWCLIGGIEKVYGISNMIMIQEKLYEVIGDNNYGLVTYNDRSNCTIADIRKLVKKASV